MSLKTKLDLLGDLFDRFDCQYTLLGNPWNRPLEDMPWFNLCEALGLSVSRSINSLRQYLPERLLAWRSILISDSDSIGFMPNRFLFQRSTMLGVGLVYFNISNLVATPFPLVDNYWRNMLRNYASVRYSWPWHIGLEQIDQPQWQELRERGIVIP